MNGTWLTAVRFLRPLRSKPGAETACCVRIVLALEARVYIPFELLPADSMYHLNSGTVIHRGAVIVSEGGLAPGLGAPRPPAASWSRGPS